MMRPEQIADSVYLIGGPDLTDPKDCLIYAVDMGELVIIDAGAGDSAYSILDNLVLLGLDHIPISHLILTHCHIDHVGGANIIKDSTGCLILAHEEDASVLLENNHPRTAASWYNKTLDPVNIDLIMKGEEMQIKLSGGTINMVHTPGHTPGSISAYVDNSDGRILFAQDVHGPFTREFSSSISDWRMSMQKLIDLEPDILCEGHFGVFKPKENAVKYIRRYLKEYEK